MIIFDTDEFIRLSQEFLQSGKALPDWLEAAVRKAKENEKEEQAFNKKMFEDVESKNKPFKSRINNLFLDFDSSLPVEYFTFNTPQIENSLNVIKENIKQFASDIENLSKQAGRNLDIENQALKITANLLDRLKENLGFSAEENKQLENKSFEEITEYYSKTRTDSITKLNHSINLFRGEIKDLEKQTLGKSKEEIKDIYQNRLREIEELTRGDRADVKIYFDKGKYQIDSINDVKTPIKTEETLKNILDKKALLDISL